MEMMEIISIDLNLCANVCLFKLKIQTNGKYNAALRARIV